MRLTQSRLNWNTRNSFRSQSQPMVRALITLALAFYSPSNARAAQSANAQSPLGINLEAVSIYYAEQPFLNIFKNVAPGTSGSTGWSTLTNIYVTTPEAAYLRLDANGYPTTLTASASDPNVPQLFSNACVMPMYELPNSNAGTGPPYRSGHYVVLYDGQGTLVYSLDASMVSRSPGRDVFNVATPAKGVRICITATDPSHTGNYLRNIRVVKAEEEKLLTAGNIFEPSFLAKMQTFRVLRFMWWLEIIDSKLSSWSNRPLPTDDGWGGANGVPLEVTLQLANAIGADPWVNVPAQADDSYIANMATLFHTNVGTNQRVYIEMSNEVWNTTYQEHDYSVNQGLAIWPHSGLSKTSVGLNWMGMRTAQMCDIWKSVWGADFSRVTCVLGAFSDIPNWATEELNCVLWTGAGNAPCAGHNIGAVAIAPYFGFQAPSTWSSLSQATAVTNIFTELNTGGLISGDYPGGVLKQVAAEEVAIAKALAPYKLPFIGYEGGQSLVGFPNYPNGSTIVNDYIAANRDPRMGADYTTYLNNWRSNGGQMFVLYEDISAANQYGEFGALESSMDTISPLSSAPVKWQAIQNFISSTPCWWTGCVGVVDKIPMPLSNFTVQ
jgi:hypothetical protein